MSNELKRRVDVPESSHASKLARPDDIDERGWGLEPEHTIFLCHSGKQKNFTERLWWELKRAHHYPFFDKCPDSLPKGHDFPSAIIQAARQCHVAILVLSEDFFTRSRWPMIELNEFVKAQASTNSNLKLLPLFYKISVEDFKDAERQKRWQDIWQGWAAEDVRCNATHKLDVGAWTFALSVVGKSNGLEYIEEIGKVTYVANVVDTVRKLKLPRVKYDVSHVQSMQRLCEVIFAKFHDSKDDNCVYKVQVVGLFGMGGVGKTTITKVMCNGLFGDFDGEFCHIEFGVKEVGVLRRQILQDLTSEASLPNDLDKMKTLLNKCMLQQRVFLCLDNVLLREDIEEAQMYLELTYKTGSKVLVTSRSRATLQSLGLQECHCMEMPEFDQSDATKLFLHHAGLVSTNDINELEWDVINGCVQACLFLKRSLHDVKNDSSTKQYLPLALKVWGVQLRQISRCPLEWKRSLEKLSTHMFNLSNDAPHPLFSLLRQGYDSLKPKDQLLFLDLAIFVIGATKYGKDKLDIVKWLQHAHGCETFSIMQSLEALKKKALLDFVMIDKVSEFPSYHVYLAFANSLRTEKVLEFRIHDLYLEFAKEEVQALESTNQMSCILYDFGKFCLPPKLRREWECRNLKRVGIYESEVTSIKSEDLLHCSQVEVLQVYSCKNLEELDVGGMHGLQVLDILGCEKLGELFQGVNKLKDLKWLRLRGLNPQLFLGDLSLTTLQFLDLWGNHLDHPPGLSGCKNLVELIRGAGSLPNLDNLTMLKRIHCWNHRMTSFIGLNSLKNLKVLELYECVSLEDLPGLSNLHALEILNVNDTNVSELYGIGTLQHLQELSVSNCEFLTSLVELEFVTSLRRLEACRCKSLYDLPNISNLKRLEVVYLDESAISMVPSGFGRLAKNRILSLFGCVELLEPLVLWLWEQELPPLEGQDDKTFFALSHFEEIEDELQSNIRKDVAYYMDQASVGSYQMDGLVSSYDVLYEEGGIDFAIKAMCEHEDLGILCLVIAKYSDVAILETAIPKLSNRIINFLNQQLNRYISGSGDYYDTDAGHPTFWRILFILEHVMENDMLMESLEVHNICSFIEKFVQGNQNLYDMWQHWDDAKPILKRWALYLNRCCFDEECLCSLFYSSKE